MKAAAGVARLEEKSFDTGVVKINYAEGPKNGPPLVLLHGITRNWQSFVSLIPELSEKWHVFAMDLRGHGRSGHVERGYDSLGYAADVLALLRQVVGEPAILFGHSAAAIAGLLAAAEEPARVRAVILGDTSLSLAGLQRSIYPALFADLRAVRLRLADTSIADMTRALADVRINIPELDFSITLGELPGNDEAYLATWATSLWQVDPEAIKMVMEDTALADDGAERLLRRVQCPTLLLQGNPELGGMMSDAEIEHAMSLLAQPTLVKFHTLGHALFLIDPQPVIEAVTTYLQRL